MRGQQHVPALRKRGRPTAEERRRRESEILTAALGVFLRCGYGASTMDELAAAAQVTKRTLYAYYGDKAGLFTAMVRDLAAAVSLDGEAERCRLGASSHLHMFSNHLHIVAATMQAGQVRTRMRPPASCTS